jgi:hypothetical protein
VEGFSRSDLQVTERQVGLVRGTRWTVGSSVVHMVQEEQDEVANMGPVQQWRPSQETRQARVDIRELEVKILAC